MNRKSLNTRTSTLLSAALTAMVGLSLQACALDTVSGEYEMEEYTTIDAEEATGVELSEEAARLDREVRPVRAGALNAQDGAEAGHDLGIGELPSDRCMHAVVKCGDDCCTANEMCIELSDPTGKHIFEYVCVARTDVSITGS